MAEPRNEFKYVSRLNAEALGEAGHRTFRILAECGSNSAVMWLEKQQLFQLAVAIRQLVLTSAGREDPHEEAIVLQPEDTPRKALEFQVGKIALGEDTITGKVIIEAHDIDLVEEGEESPAVLRAWITRAQAEGLVEEAFEVCAAGRPLCSLCGGPIDPEGHVCPRSNGHHQDVQEL